MMSVRKWLVGLILITYSVTAQSNQLSETGNQVLYQEGLAKEIDKAFDQANQLSVQQDYFEAIRLFKEIIHQYDAYLKGHYTTKLVSIYLGLSFAYSSLHNQKYEMEYVQKAIDIMDADRASFKINDYLRAYNDLYWYQNNYGDYQAGAKTFRAFSDFYHQSSMASGMTDAEKAYARRIFLKMEILELVFAYRLQDAEKKLKEFEHALGKVSSVELQDDIDYYLSCYDAFSYQFYEMENFTDALRHLQYLEQLGKRFNRPFYLMKSRTLSGSIYQKLGQYQKGLESIESALNVFEFSPYNSSKYSIETIRALCFSGMNKHDEACSLVEQNIIELVEQYSQKKTSLLSLDYKDFSTLNSHHYINIFATSAIIFKNRYLHTKSVTDLKKAENLAVIAANMFEDFYKDGVYNSTLASLQDKIAETLLFLAAELYKNDLKKKVDIIHLIERNNSQHLFKEVQRKILIANDEVSDLFNELEDLKAEERYLQGLASGKNDKSTQQLKKLSEQQASLKARIQRVYPNFMQTGADFHLDSIRRLLTEDRQLLKYYVAFESVYLLSVTDDDCSIVQLGTVQDVQRKVSKYIQALKQPKTDVRDLSKICADMLLSIKPAAQLTIIPDKFLNYLPFESLLLNNTFLLKQSVVSYAYSFPLWWMSQKQSNTTKAKLNLMAFSPEYRSSSFQGNTIQSLPFAQMEASAASKLTNGQLLMGKSATKKAFLNASSDVNVFHLAMHSLLNEVDFEQSCLLFHDNEPLFFSELYNHFSPASMVVLSACNTGNGALVDGEGIMSLSRAFSYSGVRSTILSLWQVPDKETAVLMELFYENLQKGMSKDAALQQAKIDFLEKFPMHQHPYFWSGFVINGDVSPFKSASNYIYYILFIAFAGVFIYFRKPLLKLFK